MPSASILNQINTTTMDIRKVIIALIVAIAAIGQSTATAQSSPSNMVYLELSQLTVANYPNLVEAFKAHPDFELMESCVPAKVTSIRVRNTQLSPSAIQSTLSNLLSQSGFSSVTPLLGFNDGQFLDRCKTARTRP